MAGTVVLATLTGAAAAAQVPVTVLVERPDTAQPDGGTPAEPTPVPAEPAPRPEPSDPTPAQPGPDPDLPDPDLPAGDPDPRPAPDPQPAPDPEKPDLPRTGADTLRLLRDAATAVAAGLLLILAARPTSPKEPR